jgi:DNA repair exonuclease SbcCD ATPase subunit
MAEKVISILLSAKDATASAFDRAKGGIKSLSDDTQKATSGMKAATQAVSKAMRGDLVGAAQSAASAFKALWSVVLSNPIAALVAIAATAAVGLSKLWQSHKEAEEAAKEHAEAVAELRKELDELTSGTLIDKVKEQAKALSSDGDTLELRKRIQAIKNYAAELAGMADMKLAEIGIMTDKEEIEDAKKEYGELIGMLKDLKSAQKEYEDALGDVRAAQEKAAAEEKDASEQALANKAALIRAEIQFRQEIEETFKRYEAEQAKQNAAVEDTVSAIEKQTARTIELMRAKEPLLKAEIERKHIQEDLADMMSAESADTIELAKKQSELAIKEEEIKGIKEAAAAAAAKEAADRLKGAEDILAVEEEIAKVKSPDAWDQKGWKANDPRNKVVDPWEELKKKKPEFPSPVPPLPQNPDAPGQPGAGGGMADPWSSKLDAIRNEVEHLRGDLTGGG